MVLEVQIQSLIFSLCFGMFCAFIYNLCYRWLFKGKKIIRIFINLIFVNLLSILYFVLLKGINFGIIHWYFLLIFGVGFVIGNRKTRKIRKLS